MRRAALFPLTTSTSTRRIFFILVNRQSKFKSHPSAIRKAQLEPYLTRAAKLGERNLKSQPGKRYRDSNSTNSIIRMHGLGAMRERIDCVPWWISVQFESHTHEVAVVQHFPDRKSLLGLANGQLIQMTECS